MDCWLEDEFLTVLQQSTVLESSLPFLNDLNMEQEFMPTSTEKLERRRNLSLGDSATSEICTSMHPQTSYCLRRWVETGNQTEQTSNKNRNGVKNTKIDGERSWSGSPDWDFKEGCSYDVQNYRTSGMLEDIKRLKKIDVPNTVLPLSKMKATGKNRAIMESLLDSNKKGKMPFDTSRYAEGTIVDSARDVQSSIIEEMSWVTAPAVLYRSPFGSCHSKASEASAISVHSHSAENEAPDNLSYHNALSEHGGSFLSRVKNEFDLEFFEEFEEENDEDEMKSLETCSCASENECQKEDLKSTLGKVFGLVVGLGVGAIMQIMK